MKILIIGGNGYIGSSLYLKCKELGYDVHSIDLCLFGTNYGYSQIINYNDFDIKDYTHIILLAAYSSVSMAENNKFAAWETNVNYFFNICDKLRKDQVLIYASSASVYGKTNDVCFESNINTSPINFYDLTKITDDIIANKFISEGKQLVGLRFGTLNGYSENIRSDLMINSMYYTSVIENKSIYIKNKSISRSILSIKDCVNAISAILSSPKIITGQFNLKSFDSTVDEISKVVSTMFSSTVEYVQDDPPEKIYDYKISSELFSNTYNYIFTDTIEDVCLSLMTTKDKLKFSKRD